MARLASIGDRADGLPRLRSGGGDLFGKIEGDGLCSMVRLPQLVVHRIVGAIGLEY